MQVLGYYVFVIYGQQTQDQIFSVQLHFLCTELKKILKWTEV